MKKLFSIFLIICMLWAFLPEKIFANSNDTYFVVTAYYSPLPDQKFYLKGNYEAEIRLNGRWIAGASGKWVFSGMLAAPKNYSFGTKIYLEWLGIGSVEDRGGAIVNAWNRWYSHDRIDVWMWYGDEGLRRALYWWKRTVKGSFVSNSSKITLDYNSIPAPFWATNGLEVTPSIFYKSIGKDSAASDIFALKSFLSENGVYDGEVDSNYSMDLIDKIYEFQLDNGILQQWDYIWAGYWGNKTRSTFLSHYKSGKLEEQYEQPVLVASTDNQVFLSKASNKVELEYDPDNIFSQAISTQKEISTLQEILTQLELYQGEINGNYDDLIDVIVNFQIENNLIENKNSLAAGYYWPQTRNALYEQYLEYKDYLKKVAETKQDIKELKDEIYKNSEISVINLWDLYLGQVSPQVRELQLLLADLGYFEHKDTAIFGDLTAQAIADFQLETWVINSLDEPGNGMFGPKTKSMLMEKLYEKNLSEQFDISVYDEQIIQELKKSGIL